MRVDVRRAIGALTTAAVLGIGAATVATATVSSFGPAAPVTSGGAYDRNPSVVQDGAVTRAFFARTQLTACDRLAGCPADNTLYDLYEMVSADGGATWGAPQEIADNSLFPDSPWNDPSYGRTVAATRTASGALHVFWASGGNTSSLVYGVKPPASSTWTWSSRDDLPVFNVEAVSKGDTTFVYYEDGLEGSIKVMTFDGATFGTPQTVLASANIPKAIVDASGIVRLTAVNASAWPVVNVLLTSSTDGVTFGAPVVAIAGDGVVTNWDPSLAQAADGSYHLFHAPDQGDGRQVIEHRVSATFEGLASAAPTQLTTGTDGATVYWDYWPEAFSSGSTLRLLFTSEAGTPPGTGHVWATSAAVTLPGPVTAEDCKNGGWRDFGFRNQGACVSSVAGRR